MRIAVTGTYGSGKSTLIEDFVAAYSQYARVQEPCWEVAQRGVSFADGATTAGLLAHEEAPGNPAFVAFGALFAFDTDLLPALHGVGHR